MALNAAEEETVEALKKWWDENGKQLVLMIVVVIAGYGGWLLWQNARLASADAASDLYEEILSIAAVTEGVTVSAADGARVLELADELRVDHSGSIYALFASLFDAQQAVRVNDLEAAESSLQWILDNQQSGFFKQSDAGLILTTQLRLGRVILARGDAERALILVNNVNPVSYEPGFAELRGDIYFALGRIVDAREAYVAAQQAGSNSNALRMKLDNLSDES